MSNRFITLSLTTVPTPASTGGTIPAQRHLAALAMLIIEKTDIGWSFSLRSAAIGAGDGEDRLLGWATRNLPDSGIVVGWQLADAIVAPLLDATRDCNPEVAPPFLDRLLALLAGPAVDLAIGRGGAAAPALEVTAAVDGIGVSALTPAEVETAWSFGDTAQLQRHARAQVLAACRLWFAEAPSDSFAVKEAFTRWLAGADVGGGPVEIGS